MRNPAGRAVVLGDDVSTDLIIPGRYCGIGDPAALARHIFEATEWEGMVVPGSVIVAGRNMGMGSSREQAPVALKAAGVAGVAAESFGRIFFRNAINIGLPVLCVPGAGGGVRSGQLVSLDLRKGLLRNESTGGVFRGEPLPPFLLEILRDGGLVPHLRRALRRGRGHPVRKERTSGRRAGRSEGGRSTRSGAVPGAEAGGDTRRATSPGGSAREGGRGRSRW